MQFLRAMQKKQKQKNKKYHFRTEAVQETDESVNWLDKLGNQDPLDML